MEDLDIMGCEKGCVISLCLSFENYIIFYSYEICLFGSGREDNNSRVTLGKPMPRSMDFISMLCNAELF